MICVTGGESSLRQLAARLEANEGAELQEVRLDLLRPFDDAVLPLLRSPRVIATCRGTAEGGGFSGTAGEQAQLLARALEQGPGYLDLELTLPYELRQGLFEARGGTQVILSHHDFEPDAAARLALLDLCQQPADLLKVAAFVQDAAELVPLRIALAKETRPVLRIGMGEAGVISRVLYTRFGSPWTYAAAEATSVVAPGQLTLERARRWRVDQAARLTPLGLVGGAQVMASPGPRVYNALFSRRSWSWIYLPVVTARPGATLELLRELGFGGCSVTMPAKEALASQMDELRSPAGALGAINTVVLDSAGGRQVGLNTDAAAIESLLRSHSGQSALVLGGGGAARAAVFALGRLDCPVTLCCRDEQRAATLQRQLKIATLPWQRRHEAASRVVINATPLGSDGVTDPLIQRTTWDGCVVLDMVNTATPTPLLQRASAGGAITICGLEMWLLQGALQMEALTGHSVTAEDLRELLDD